MSFAVFQKQANVRCYAFASHMMRKTSSSSRATHRAGFWGNGARGGSLPSSHFSTSTTAPSAASSKENSSYFLQKAKESISIAGSCEVKSFGGLSYVGGPSSEDYRVVFVLGGPGAGKGTQSEMLLQNYPCVHLSAGQLLREETTRKDSPHAALIEQCLVAGNIVPVEISLSLLQNAMQEAKGKSVIFLVDGFPRNFDNLEGWTRCMKGVSAVAGVLVYQCPLSVLEERILNRGKESGRSDDNVETLRRRFKTFEQDTTPVIDTLRLIAEETPLKVFDISGDQPLERVWKDTQEVMNAVIANDVIAANMKLLEAISVGDVEMYRSLAADEMFSELSPEKVMNDQEGFSDFSSIVVSNAEIAFLSGTKVSLSYDRASTTSIIRESRVWSHNGDGWKLVHFSRAPN